MGDVGARPSIADVALQTLHRNKGVAAFAVEHVEAWIEAEREQLPLWIPVGVLSGIGGWFLATSPTSAGAILCAAAGAGLGLLAIGGRGRIARALGLFALATALGCALVWARAERVRAQPLDRPRVATVSGVVERVDPLPAREALRLTVRPDDAMLPRRVRITVPVEDAGPGIATGAAIAVRARLVPPPPAAVPGAYDYAAIAWFAGVGATGKALDPIRVTVPATPGGIARWLADARIALGRHILSRLPGGPGGIAVALATGDMGAVPAADTDAFRRSGLAHLLSVSGLHLTAAVGVSMLIVLRLLALSRWGATRLPLPLIAAGAGALVGIAYTLLTGAEVPTVRSLVAALAVLAAMALGREALTLRLVALGALVCLLPWPEQAAGPSFQLSFAAILSIVAFHELGWTRRFVERREEAWWRRFGRSLAALLFTGLVVELALMPIAVFHFHRAGFYGAVANIVAIPLTTFVIMPLEALALLADMAGAGAPVWWLAGKALRLLLALAHRVASLPGAVALVPTMGRAAFAAIVVGGLWLALWRTRARLLGVAPIVAGIAATVLACPPDLLVTGDGRHLALRTARGEVALLRERTGDYLRDAMSEVEGREGDAALAIDTLPEARCGPDTCAFVVSRGGRTWRILATRSRYPVDRAPFARACAAADIVVSDRRLPGWCRPHWLKADAALLATTGGLAIRFAPPTIETVAAMQRGKPWAIGHERSGQGVQHE